MTEKISENQKMLNLWAVILIVWSVYRYYFHLPDWFDEFIAKPIVFVAPVYFYIKKREKKEFFTAINWNLKPVASNLFFGFAIGLIFFITALFGNYIKFQKFVFLPGKAINLLNIFLIICLALATSITEEILSRGFVLKRLYEESKNIYTSSFFSSILFFFLHVPILFTNIKITGNLLLYFMVTDLLLSLTVSFIYLEKKDLNLPILVHLFYNLSIYFFT
ncbi:MAG: CPBP family glutamic-type intramembrane protease [Microgenomates group bacterium]|nr:CPBP family glutamic-type intramembrane protease [Microgenomates group bacterium]